MRKNISTNTPSEKRVGYSRAVVVNNRLYISGTTSVDKQGNVVGKNLYTQTEFILDRMQKVLKETDFSLADVVSVTAYLTDMKQLSEFDQAFRDHFYAIKPCCTVVGVKELVHPDMLIEIEVIAEKLTST